MKLKAVTSRDNPQFKRMKALASSSQARRTAGLSILDGVHLVETCIAAWGAPALLAVSESGIKRPEIARLAASAEGEVLQFPDPMFEALSTVLHGAGIVAAVHTPRRELPRSINGDCLLVDHLQDPGNLGSLLRSAAAAGLAQVFCSPGTVYAWSPKVLRAGQGAHFGLTIVEGVELEAVIARLQVPLLVTTSHHASLLWDLDLGGPQAWLFGNEGAGVAPGLLRHATHRVGIPMPGGGESLNVAAAGAICMFESVRQRAAGSKGTR